FSRRFAVEELGRGAYSTVRVGVNKETGKRVAVKCIERARLRPADVGALRQEAGLLAQLRHPNIVELYGFFEEPEMFYMPLELCDGGELFDRIVVKQFYTEREARDLVRTLLTAVAYCHANGVVHRDLKPENLLLVSKDDDTSIKIADFGFAKAAGGVDVLQTQCGTPGYVAPEILRNIAYGAPVDMWSIGVITYILLAGYPPFSDDNQARLFLKIKKGRFQFHEQYWGGVSEEAKDLIRQLLIVLPEGRITADAALQHPWVLESEDQLSQRNLAGALKTMQLFNA
ncbi:unnamed protein product, partial [Phaeothamnion confervicola]